MKQVPGIWISGAIVGLAVLYVLLLPKLFSELNYLPGALKLPLSVLLIGSLAFLMGMPFPLGLEVVSSKLPGWIP